jgi:hypothetical protein
MEYMPISSLEDADRSRPSQAIKGVVTLIWPFSSSARKAAFLLAEPDFRLRNKKGQVRVQLQGAAAVAVARARIAIGDQLALCLAAAKWVQQEPGLGTPGKSVELELLYRNAIVLEVGIGSWL